LEDLLYLATAHGALASLNGESELHHHAPRVSPCLHVYLGRPQEKTDKMATVVLGPILHLMPPWGNGRGAKLGRKRTMTPAQILSKVGGCEALFP